MKESKEAPMRELHLKRLELLSEVRRAQSQLIKVEREILKEGGFLADFAQPSQPCW